MCLVSFCLTMVILYTGKSVCNFFTRKRMEEGAFASVRVRDGAPNMLILNGQSGEVGASKIKVRFLDDGFISIQGINNTESRQWKQISSVELEPGTYTLSELSCDSDESLQIQLNYHDPDGNMVWHFQWYEDITFTIEKKEIADVYILVMPNAELDEIVRPTLYKENEIESTDN